jgi:hypothetical protein
MTRWANRDASEAAERSEPLSFRGDLVASARALRRAPMLIVITLVLSVPVRALGRPEAIVSLPIEIILVGFLGTQRVWLAALYEGDVMPWREIWSTTRSFIGRFVALGLVVAAASIPIDLGLSFVVLRMGASFPAVIVIDVGYALVLDVALTFVVPALALTTPSVGKALRIGLRMIRRTWPSCAWYVLTPGLTLVAVAQAFRPSSTTVVATAALVAITSALALWFKGAIVAFYLRQDRSLPEG